MNEQQNKDGLIAAISAIVAAVAALGHYFGLSPEWTSPYFVDVIIGFGSGAVSAFYAARRIASGGAAAPSSDA